MQLVTEIYQATQAVPRGELYRLTNQLRKEAVSVFSDFAEEQMRFSSKEFRLFLSHARGSLVELETQLMIALSLGYLRANQNRALLDEAEELGRILNGFTATVEPDWGLRPEYSQLGAQPECRMCITSPSCTM